MPPEHLLVPISGSGVLIGLWVRGDGNSRSLGSRANRSDADSLGRGCGGCGCDGLGGGAGSDGSGVDPAIATIVTPDNTSRDGDSQGQEKEEVELHFESG